MGSAPSTAVPRGATPCAAHGARGQHTLWLAPLLAACKTPDGTAGKSQLRSPSPAAPQSWQGCRASSRAAEPLREGLGTSPSGGLPLMGADTARVRGGE